MRRQRKLLRSTLGWQTLCGGRNGGRQEHDEEREGSTVPYPKMLRVRQKFERAKVEDAAGTVGVELEKLDLSKRIKPGQSVALTAGSRGITNIPVILQSA